MNELQAFTSREFGTLDMLLLGEQGIVGTP